MTPAERSWISAQTTILEETLTGPDCRNFRVEIAPALTFLFVSKANARTDDIATPELRLEVYKALLTLPGTPAALAVHALTGIILGETSRPYQWLPDPSEVRQEIEHARSVLSHRLIGFRHLLKARPREPDTPALPPAELHAKMLGLLGTLKIAPPSLPTMPRTEPVIPVTVPVPADERELAVKIAARKAEGRDMTPDELAAEIARLETKREAS